MDTRPDESSPSESQAPRSPPVPVPGATPAWKPHPLSRTLGQDWRAFLDFTGGSLLFCLSAMFIILGIARVLGPALEQPTTFLEILPTLGVMHLYELCLLAALIFLVVWRNVTDDAVSLVVIAGLFLLSGGLMLPRWPTATPRAPGWWGRRARRLARPSWRHCGDRSGWICARWL